MTNEQSKTKNLEEEVQGEKERSEKYRKSLEEERKRLEELTLKGKANVEKLENLLQEKADQQDELNEKLMELADEKNRLLKVCPIAFRNRSTKRPSQISAPFCLSWALIWSFEIRGGNRLENSASCMEGRELLGKERMTLFL